VTKKTLIVIIPHLIVSPQMGGQGTRIPPRATGRGAGGRENKKPPPGQALGVGSRGAVVPPFVLNPPAASIGGGTLSGEGTPLAPFRRGGRRGPKTSGGPGKKKAGRNCFREGGEGGRRAVPRGGARGPEAGARNIFRRLFGAGKKQTPHRAFPAGGGIFKRAEGAQPGGGGGEKKGGDKKGGPPPPKKQKCRAPPANGTVFFLHTRRKGGGPGRGFPGFFRSGPNWGFRRLCSTKKKGRDDPGTPKGGGTGPEHGGAQKTPGFRGRYGGGDHVVATTFGTPGGGRGGGRKTAKRRGRLEYGENFGWAQNSKARRVRHPFARWLKRGGTKGENN